jgi:hypothetical protein
MGFTTLRDLGLNSSRGLLVTDLCAIRDAINAGILEGPRMLIGGVHDHHRFAPRPDPAARAQRWGFQTADGPWELRKLARTNLLAGCDIIKTCAIGRRRHRQGRTGHPQHDAGGARRHRRRGARFPQGRRGALLHAQASAWRSRRAPTPSSTWSSTRTRPST